MRWRTVVAENQHRRGAATSVTRRWSAVAGIAALIVVVAAAIELAMGRVPWCTCGYIKLWEGVVKSSGNSQHLTDWYTPSHMIHGILFYLVLWLVARRVPTEWRFLLAVLVEASWEVFENTPFTINRYRAATISLDYYGDSAINSVSDTLAMMIGFLIAHRAPVWASLAFVIVMELLVGTVIRDNLTLNILMLIHPFDVIKRWQMSA
jgi:hypothetical protein